MKTSEIIEYPVVNDDALDVDPIYKKFQAKGPVMVKLRFGEPCWLATRYEDVRTVYGDRRFGRALGLRVMHRGPGSERSWPRTPPCWSTWTLRSRAACGA